MQQVNAKSLWVEREGEGPPVVLVHGLADATDSDLTRIGAPVRLLTGADDKVCQPAACEALAGELASASVEVFDGCGHWTAVEAARPVNASRRAFFS